VLLAEAARAGLAALATGRAGVSGVGLAEAARALLTRAAGVGGVLLAEAAGAGLAALLRLLLGVVAVAELSGVVLISHRGTPFHVRRSIRSAERPARGFDG